MVKKVGKVEVIFFAKVQKQPFCEILSLQNFDRTLKRLIAISTEFAKFGKIAKRSDVPF